MMPRFRLSARGFAGGARRGGRAVMDALKSRVAQKLVAGFVVVIALAAAVGWLGLASASNSKKDLDVVVSTKLDTLSNINEVSEAVARTQQLTLAYVVASDDLGRVGIGTELASRDGAVDSFLTEAEQSAVTPAEVTAFDQLRTAWDGYKRARDSKVIRRSVQNLEAARTAATGEVQNKFGIVLTNLHQIEQMETDEVRELRADARTAYEEGRSRVVMVLLAAVIIGLVVAFALAGRMGRDLRSLEAAAEAFSKGDLGRRAEVESRDEIHHLAEAFNSMAARLQDMVIADRVVKEALEGAVGDYSAFADAVKNGDLTRRVATNGSAQLSALSAGLNGMVEGLASMSLRVATSATDLATSATQILATVSRQGATVTEQSVAISQTSVTVDELRASAEHAAHKASEVAAKAQASVEVGDDGARVISAIIAGMGEIEACVESIATHIVALSDQTRQIADLTATVDDISEQSNLLALNAAIEAARAGEHGKGFSVVAQEIRNLAEQSKAGTAQVRSILADIQGATNAAVMATEQGVKVVKQGRSQASRADGALQSLSDTIRSTAQSATQISASAQQQSVAIDQIADAMTDINSATSEFVAGTKESESAARSLAQMADELTQLTAAYRLREAASVPPAGIGEAPPPAATSVGRRR